MDKKEYFKIYNKKYYLENKEKWQEYANSEYRKRYNSMYYQSNKEKYNERYKNFIKDYEGKFVYFIMDGKDNSMKYIGSSCNLYARFGWHRYKKTKYNPEEDYVLYLDFTNKFNEEELFDAESYFISLYKPKLNKHYKDFDGNILLKITDRDLVFKEFKLDGGKDE